MRMDKLTSKFQLALADAQSLATGLDHQLIEPVHVMAALLDQEGGASRHLLTKAGVRVNALRSQLGERLDSLSGGAMQLKIYSGGQLGNERESLELLQLGMLDFAKVASSVLENFVPAMGVFSLPYLFRDSDHYWQVFGGEVGQEILAQSDLALIRLCGAYCSICSSKSSPASSRLGHMSFHSLALHCGNCVL